MIFDWISQKKIFSNKNIFLFNEILCKKKKTSTIIIYSANFNREKSHRHTRTFLFFLSGWRKKNRMKIMCVLPSLAFSTLPFIAGASENWWFFFLFSNTLSLLKVRWRERSNTTFNILCRTKFSKEYNADEHLNSF